MDEPDMKGVGKHGRQRALHRQKHSGLTLPVTSRKQGQLSTAGCVIGMDGDES